MKSNIKIYLFVILLVQSHFNFSYGKYLFAKESKILPASEIKRISETVTNYLQQVVGREKPTLSDYFLAKLFFIVLNQMKGKKIDNTPPRFWYSREGR